jgi:hypothetical protein
MYEIHKIEKYGAWIGWMVTNGHRWTEGAGQIDVDVNGWWQMTTLTEMWWTVTDREYNSDDVVKQFASASSTIMACRKKKRRIFFFYFMFLFLKHYFLRFFNGSCSLFLWSFVRRTDINGNKEMIFEEMKKVKCLLI